MWIQNLLHELGQKSLQVPTLFCDNTGATYVCANPVFHSKMKHVSLNYHFVREQVQQRRLKVHHVSSRDQLADIFSKALPRQPFQYLRSKICVSDGNTILRGSIKTTSSVD